MLRSHRVRPSYLLVIEWLDEGERKTGTELCELLKGTLIPMELVPCRTKADVLAALLKASERVLLERAIPIIQFEAHGCHEGIAPSRHGGDLLTWKELASPLRNINLLSRFNLVVVGAACYGFSAISSFDVNNACPYTIGIGFSSGVFEGRLATTMRDFHRELLCSGRYDLNTAIDAARNDLGSDGTFDAMNCETMGQHLLTAYAKKQFSQEEKRALIQRIQEQLASEEIPLDRDEFEKKTVAALRATIKSFVAKWFAYASIPENEERFSLDVDAILDSVEIAS